MSKTLVIKSSILGANSVSSAMADAFIARSAAKNQASVVTVRDLGLKPLPHLRADVLGQMHSNSTDLSSAAIEGNLALAELLAADTLVLAVPMYNFSVPSTLKAWFDHVLHPGQTFEYTVSGHRGLLSAKKAIVLISSAGDYSEAPASGMDFVEPYVRAILGFMGITDITVIKVDASAMGDVGAARKTAAFAAIEAL